jgi:transposase
MERRFHGIDLHKQYATIMVRNSEGGEIKFTSHCSDFRDYIQRLDGNDVVVVESINNAFYWSDEIEKQGAKCIIVDPHKFKIIKDSWNKTDKRDSANLSIALWMAETRSEFRLPSVYKPSLIIRDLRKLFSLYQTLCEQITQHKNSIQAAFVEKGIALTDKQKYELFKSNGDISIISEYNISGATETCIVSSLVIMKTLSSQKEHIKTLIIKMGKHFSKEVKLLITIKGVSPLLSLAFLADVGDITRFPNVKSFNAYLGVVPSVKSSGGKTQMGHITRQSRNLSRTLFTQPVNHIISSSESMSEFYTGIKLRRGVGRSRIAVIRKTFNIMRRMLLTGKEYRGKDESTFQKKLKDFEKIIQNAA